MLTAISAIFATLAAIFLCLPLYSKPENQLDAGEEDAGSIHLKQSELLERLTEIEADHRAGRIETEVYGSLKSEYMEELKAIS